MNEDLGKAIIKLIISILLFLATISACYVLFTAFVELADLVKAGEIHASVLRALIGLVMVNGITLVYLRLKFSDAEVRA